MRRFRGKKEGRLPRVRIEWVPVQMYGLGHLGFDHLQLVFEPGDGGNSAQDDWFVMEGVRDATQEGIFLGIEGADGRTTLAMANLASRGDLTSKIGTPDHRGSRPLLYDGDEFRAWETIANYARDIEAEDYPYIAFGLPGSPTPTINSSSAIASLVHYSGLDPTQTLPYGIHLSPGTSTLLGTSGDDRLRVEHGFTTLLGGRGGDSFFGSAQPRQIEKFYGGEGDDVFRWSPGFNIVHGGQPQLGYAADGTDVIDYSGAGEVTITFNRHWIPHKSPNFVAVFETGSDHLFSIERIQWNAKTDRIVLGKGIDLLEDNRVLPPGAELDRADLRSAAIVAHDAAIIGEASAGDDRGNRLVGTRAGETIDAKAGDDTLYGGEGHDHLVGGTGSDAYVYLPDDGNDVIVDLAGNADVDELLLTGGISIADLAVFRIGDGDLLLTVPGGSILVESFFTASDAGIERVAFDHTPALTRTDLERLAGALPAEDAFHLPAILADWSETLGLATTPGQHAEPFGLGLF
jgi:Ca2+-binding RTX toxin-like protein